VFLLFALGERDDDCLWARDDDARHTATRGDATATFARVVRVCSCVRARVVAKGVETRASVSGRVFVWI
jgi:hypothetical protein